MKVQFSINLIIWFKVWGKLGMMSLTERNQLNYSYDKVEGELGGRGKLGGRSDHRELR